MNNRSKTLTRRRFLQAAGAVALSAPAFSQSAGRKTPSETLYVAGVGAGGMGGLDIRQADAAGVKIVALCDVDERRAAPVFDAFPDATKYVDYRELLEKEKGIDAVIVGIPDHMHAFVSLAAIELGKHVYCEKPLAHTMHEVRAVTEAARRQGVATQLGNQGRSFESTRTFVECIQSGALGHVREVHLYEAGHSACRIDELPKRSEKHEVPAELDWEQWLGSARYRDYNPIYLPGTWRGWTSFGSGMLGDWLCHLADPVFLALDLGAPTSAVAEAEGYDPVEHADTYPRSTHAKFEFNATADRPGVTLHWYDGDIYAPPRPESLAPDEPFIPIPKTGWSNGKPFGALVVGEKGAIVYGSHGATGWHMISHEDDAVLEADRKRAAEAADEAGAFPSSLPHMKNWIAACKGGAPAHSDFSYGGPLTEIAMLGNVAIRELGEELKWDAKAMRITNNDEANAHLKGTYREGWNI